MSKSKQWTVLGNRWSVSGERSRRIGCSLVAACCLLFAAGCRMDMQDQPRYEVYESSAFFKDGLASRPLVEGTVPRGYLHADKEFYTGKIDRTKQANAATTANQTSGERTANGNSGAQAGDGAQATGAANSNSGGANTPAASGGGGGGGGTAQGDPNDVTTFPFPVTREVVERGRERYGIFCAMCHGATGYGDGIIIRRGFSNKRPSYHTDELRTARVGHFFDVITNGWGTMPSYAQQIPARDRWAIIAYVRALQLSQQGATAAPATAPTAGAVVEAPGTGGPK